MIKIYCWMRIKKHLFYIATTMKSYVNLLPVLWIVQKILIFMKSCFWQQILQLKIFLLTNILTPKTFLGNFYFKRKIGSGQFWQISPWALVKFAIHHHKNEAMYKVNLPNTQGDPIFTHSKFQTAHPGV